MELNYCYNCLNKLYPNETICPKCGNDNSLFTNDEKSLPAGTILNGKYFIGKVLGKGGFGITYLGYDLSLDILVAIKEYFPAALSTRVYDSIQVSALTENLEKDFGDGREKFQKEAKILARFNSSVIVHVREYFRENGTAYIVMDYIDGHNLTSYVDERGGKLSWQKTLSLFKPLVSELEKLHNQNLIHRDIKPDNLCITKNNFGEEKLMLLDFGAARNFDSQNDLKTITAMITPGFSPPEQYSAKSSQGAFTDVYALCATMYAVITGSVPPNSMDRVLGLSDIVSFKSFEIDVPSSVERAIRHGLETKSEKRTQTMQTLYTELYEDLPSESDDVDKKNKTFFNKKWLIPVAALGFTFAAFFIYSEIKKSNPQIIETQFVNPISEIMQDQKDSLHESYATASLAAIEFTKTIKPISTTAVISTNTNTPVPSYTSIQTDTNTPAPSYTSAPTDTNTPVPSYTPIPTDTNTPAPSYTSAPTDTNTPVPSYTPIPTDTNTPIPSYTPIPTDTNTPVPSYTPIPTDTNTPVPSNTTLPTYSIIPTEVNVPVPTIIVTTGVSKIADSSWQKTAVSVESHMDYSTLTPLDSYKFGQVAFENSDYERALRHLKYAAENSIAEAQFRLGYMYYNGIGVSQSYTTAADYYHKASDNGDFYATYNLGMMYENGEGVSQSYEKALEFYKKSASSNYADAQNAIGRIYYLGIGRNADYSEALKWFKLAASQNFADSQNYLGHMYYNGQGVEKSDKQAFEYFKKASDQGHPAALLNLGNMYANGTYVEKSYTKAVEYYEKSAEYKYNLALFNLGFMYFQGFGVRQSDTKAAEYYKKAADLGYADAQYNIAIMYENGIGVQQSYAQALKYYQMAADQGIKEAYIEAETLKRTVTPDQSISTGK